MEKTKFRMFFRPSVYRMVINQSSILALGYPKRVRLLFNEEKKELIVQPCNEHETLAFKVPKDFMEDSHGFEITSKIFMHKIYSQLGWDIKNRYRVYGKHYEKDNVVVFSFENCEIITDEEANNEG